MRIALMVTGLLISSLAFADIPPDPKYVETCTVKQQQKKGETCQSCSTYFKEATKCSDFLGTRGYSKRCQTSGASTWTEVWCQRGENLPNPLSVSPKKPTEDPVQPAETPTSEPAVVVTPEPSSNEPESQPEPSNQSQTTPPTTVKKKTGACAVEPGESGAGVWLLGAMLGWLSWRRRARG